MIDLAVSYTRIRNGFDMELAAEIAQRNGCDGNLERADGETDAELVARIVSTYLALTSSERTDD